MSSMEFSQIQAAAIDGRMHTVYHRQEQLERLCKALISNVDKIRDAIATDYGHSPAEVAVEYSITLNAVKKYYSMLKPKEFHEEEYLIANGKDAVGRRVPAGIVYIEPGMHTMFYSAVVPVANAFASGNCVVLLLENNPRALPGFLRRILTEALDADVFATTSSPIKDEKLLRQAICVFQNGTQNDQLKIIERTHFSQSSVVAVVDRTADVQIAAKEIVAARFSFGGRSPYAPDVVLVNEFRKKDFLQAVVSECVKFGSGVETNGDVKANTPSRSTVNEQIATFNKIDPDLRTILQESRLAVVDMASRDAVLSHKISAPVLAVHGVKSLDDAIDLVSSRSEKPCVAAYHFCSPAAGKYLSQFIDADLSHINQIPRLLLIGPVHPIGYTTIPNPFHFFTVAKPAFISSGIKTSDDLTQALESASNRTAQKMLADASKPLVESKRHPGGSMGFFEAGFVMNASLILVSTLTLSITGGWWLWRYTRSLS